jgi:hypothetical protein
MKRISFLGAVLSLLIISPIQAQPVAGPGLNPVPEPPTMQASVNDVRGLVLAHLQTFWRPGPGAERAIADSRRALNAHPAAVQTLIDMYDSETASAVDEADHVARGRARWSLVLVLGELRNSRAAAALERIAESPLPDPGAVSEAVFASEYRIRLRAIDGLGKVGAIAVLERIYQRGGGFTGAAARALLELGQPPAGVKLSYDRSLIPIGETPDFNPKPEPKPTMDLPKLSGQTP